MANFNVLVGQEFHSMKRIAFIENQADLDLILEDESQKGVEGSQLHLINLNSALDVSGSLSNRDHIEYHGEEEYSSPLVNPEQASVQVVERVREWLQNERFSNLFSCEGYELSEVFEHNLTRSITTLCKYIDILHKVLKMEAPDEIIFISEKNGLSEGDLRIIDGDRIVGRILDKLIDQRVISESIQLCKIQTFKTPIVKKDNKKWLERVLEYVRALGTAWFDAKSHKKAVLFMGAPRLMFPITEEIERQGEWEVKYLQDSVAPRVLLWSWRNQIPYYTEKDSTGGSPYFTIDALVSLVEEEKIFQYKGIQLLDILSHKLEKLSRDLIPSWMQKIKYYERLLVNQRVKVVVMDEDLSYRNRLLILAAKKMGVMSIEYQHGMGIKYFLQRPVTDKRIVWGKSFRDEIVQKVGMEAENIIVTGPLHLRHLREGDIEKRSLEDLEDVRKRYGIPKHKKIVLYASRPFHKSSKGGVQGVHQSRSEAENIMEEIVEVMGQLKDVHLIIKLHHGDKNIQFYHECIERSGFDISYSVESKLSIYKIMYACKLLLAPFSTVILEGIFTDTPIILMNLEGKPPRFPYVEWGAVDSVDYKGCLLNRVKSALVNPEKFMIPFEKGRGAIFEEFSFNSSALSFEVEMEREKVSA